MLSNLRWKLLLLLCCCVIFLAKQTSAATQLTVIPLANRPAAEIQALIAPFLAPNDRVIADGSNLIINTSAQRLVEIKQLIAQLDIRPKNLLITVIQGKNISAREFNASAQVKLKIPMHNPDLSQGIVAGSLQQNRMHDHNHYTQTVRTLEGHSAYIKVGKTEVRPNRQIRRPDAAYPLILSSAELLEATTGFSVTPRLTGEQVIIKVAPWSEQLQRNGQIKTHSAETTLHAKLGEWVEIGGSHKNQTFNSKGLLSTTRRHQDDSTRILIKVDQE